MDKKNKTKNIVSSKFYPPVVTVVGHVDHGKTTLLDAIRKSNIAQGEHGGITQRIGASKIEFINEGEKRSITFIDTPGHEAFSDMRGRGVMAADVGLLVVSSVDGVMPQTKESINFLKEADTPFIVVLTKSDLPQKNPEKAKRELLKAGVLLEGYGGNVPVIEVSAKTNTNIKELLSLILLVFEMKNEGLGSSEEGESRGVVIESKRDQRIGPVSTIVIKNGTLSVRDEISADEILGRVKSLTDTLGKRVDSATVGEAVEVLGFEKVPQVGSVVLKKGSGAQVAHKNFRVHSAGMVPSDQKASGANANSENFVSSPRQIGSPDEENPLLSIIICADTLGSLEAIVNALPPQINIVFQKTGDISPADLLLAKSVGAIVLGFNIKIKPEIMKLAKTEKVLAKNYSLIYELIDEITDVLEGRELSLVEEILGRAKIVAQFPFEKTKVMGVAILEGRMAKGDKIRLVRKDEAIGESTILSLRQGKNSISKVEKGNEAGIIISPFLDFTIGDMVISHG